MAKFGKWIGGGLGWTFGGPIGALVGFAVGSALDTAFTGEDENTSAYQRYKKTKPGDFGVSLLVLIAAVMKADGKVVKSELNYVKQYFLKQFGSEQSQEHLIAL